MMVWGTFVFFMPMAAFSVTTLPDSLLTVDKAIAYCLQSPDTSKAILQKLKERDSVPLWQIYMSEAYIQRRHFHYSKAIVLYQLAMETQEVKKDCALRAEVYRGLMLCHDMLMDDLSLTDDIYQLHECGEACKNEAYMAIAVFVKGKSLHHHGQKERSFPICTEALEKLKKHDFIDKHRTILICYHILSKLYRYDGRFDEALKMSQEEEKLMNTPGTSNIIGERNELLRCIYANRASLLAEAGRQEEASIAYQQWKTHGHGHPFADREILSYLLATSLLDEGLDIAGRYKDYLTEEGDSINIKMLDAMYYESHFYSLKNDYKSANQNISRMASIAYQLHQMTSKKEMSTRYQSLLEKEQLRQRYMWMLSLSLLLLGILIVGGLVYWYKHLVYKQRQHILLARNRIKAYQAAALKAEKADNQDIQAPVPQAEEEEEIDEDEMLFVELDKKIDKDKLYLDPNFSREDLMRLINVDKNRIGRILSSYCTSSNASTYINQKRASYAAKYMKKHPDYTIAAVVEACGMSNAVTLNRTFKEIFGETPSAYRERIIKGGSVKN